jgi:hypothetical protein
MIIPLTALTIIAAAILLIVLGWGLLRIGLALESIGRSLDKIAMGVRAIEVETSPLPRQIENINSSLAPVVSGFQSIGRDLQGVDTLLGTVAGKLGIR